MKNQAMRLGELLCSALNIDPNTTTRLVLACTVGELPRVEVTHLVMDDDVAGEITHIVKQYELHAIDHPQEDA